MNRGVKLSALMLALWIVVSVRGPQASNADMHSVFTPERIIFQPSGF